MRWGRLRGWTLNVIPRVLQKARERDVMTEAEVREEREIGGHSAARGEEKQEQETRGLQSLERGAQIFPQSLREDGSPHPDTLIYSFRQP